jgi:subtilisin-like proprotein convertase family protein
MRYHLAFWLLALSVGGLAKGNALAYSTSVNNLSATIPDGDPNGYQNSFALSGLGGPVTHVSVTLNISGGFNGDLYAYLLHNHTNAILLNRVGLSSSSSVGYPDAGFGLDAATNSFTLDDLAAHDVHAYRTFPYALNGSGQLTGVWQPDGRAIDPTSAGSAFDTATRSNPLGVFNGMDPNGLWSLYIADLSPGGVSTLNGWGLTISVPEPRSTVLLGLGLLGIFPALRSRLRNSDRPGA